MVPILVPHLDKMSKCDKLLTQARNSPKNYAYDDICKLAECYGFIKDRQKGSHAIYKHPDFPGAMMNFQKTDGKKAKWRQVKQLLNFIDDNGLDTSE